MESEAKDISSDLLGTVVRPPSIRVSGSFKSTLSGRLTPRSSPSFRRSPSVRTPSAKDSRHLAPPPLPWYRKLFFGRRVLPWLAVVSFWGCIALFLQSRWAHVDEQASLRTQFDDQASLRTQYHADQDAASHIIIEEKKHVQQEKIRPHSEGRSKQPSDGTKEAQISENALHATPEKGWWESESTSFEPVTLRPAIAGSWIFPSIGTVNTSVGTLVGPFENVEDSILGSFQKLGSRSPDKKFAKYVKGRSFMLIFHELSMTGSPLAMLELADELLSCGAHVFAVTLSQKGGLLHELFARKIKLLKSKDASTFKAAATADIIIAGSAVCASWIEKYDWQNKAGCKKLLWWIMENRKEYFDRSKHMLSVAKVLIFLSEVQMKQWRTWSESEGIRLPQMLRAISLCVNEDVALKAGIYTQSMTRENEVQKLRDVVRAEIGLEPQDVLFTTLSSINPGKGQLKLLEAIDMVVKNLGDASLLENEKYSLVHKGPNLVPRLRLLIGSVGSKSNKVDYVQKMVKFITDHPQLAEIVLWTQVTTHVASLYAASDVYVMNSQGLGETFGRVTVEAMAFALPVLGTSAGGTPEIVDDNSTGLLHPVGGDGVHVLAQHIKTVFGNATLRQYLGFQGKEKVRQKYLQDVMYEAIGLLFSTL